MNTFGKTRGRGERERVSSVYSINQTTASGSERLRVIVYLARARAERGNESESLVSRLLFRAERSEGSGIKRLQPGSLLHEQQRRA